LIAFRISFSFVAMLGLAIMHRRHFLEVLAALAATPYLRADDAPPKQIVVAGGGIIGTSIAYHLARRGARVTLLEKLRPGSGATGNSFAWLNATFSKQPRNYFDLNLFGIAGWHRLQQELNGSLQIQWGGCVEWYPGGKDADQLRQDVRNHHDWGYDTRFVDESEFRQLLPNVVSGPTEAASFSAPEGTLDPLHAVNALMQAGKQSGVHVVYPCEVTSLELSSGSIRAVETTKGRFPADVFVLACGLDSPYLGRMAGLEIPLRSTPGVLAHTAPMPRLLERIALAPGAHLKQTPDGRIVTGMEFGGVLSSDKSLARGREMLREASRFLPGLKNAPLERVTLGWRVLPKDEFPIVGFDGRCPNLYLAAMHSGMTLAPIIGQFAATEILDGTPVKLLEPYRLSRFTV
jgi:glycine/D-amino acid oxidase-like deaminating enzyme